MRAPRRVQAIAALLCAAALPALADELPAAAEKPLWCASAFNWLARDADDAADPAEAEILDAWSLLFTDLAILALREAGYAQAAIDAAIGASDQAVLAEMQDRRLRYEIESCPELEPAEKADAP